MNREKQAATTIASKRPKVTVENIGHHRSLRWESWFAQCHVGGCDWSYENIAKSDVTMQASWHRQAHRAAVTS